MNKEDIKTKILKEGKDSDWGLYGPCSSGGLQLSQLPPAFG